jgi:folylpolyglutamate synthase/dihydropteroate synthase
MRKSFNLDIESALNEAIEYAKSKQGCGVVVMGSIALAGAVRELL